MVPDKHKKGGQTLYYIHTRKNLRILKLIFKLECLHYYQKWHRILEPKTIY